ncbi:MAG: radical SAM protein [Elusimicrobiota bacterium]
MKRDGALDREGGAGAPAEDAAAERSGREAFDEPKCFDILLHYACQAKCLFCSQDFGWREEPNLMPFRAAAEKIFWAHQHGFRRLGFTGGEPTLRKDLAKLLVLARKVGFTYTRIQTNGVRLADPDYAGALADAGLTFVKLSVHGHDAETHDGLAGMPGSFDACLKAIENLKRLKIGVGVNIVLNKRNYQRLVEFYELFLLKLRLSNFVIIAPLYEGNMTRNVAGMGARLTDMASHIRRAYEVFERIDFPKPPLLLHFTPCVLPGYEQQMLGWSSFNTMVVNPDGEQKDLDETMTQHTVKTKACRACVYNDRCIGLDRSYAERFGTGELSPLKAVPERYGRARRGEGPHEGRPVLTDNETCAIEVLKHKSGVSTSEFLRIAERFPICKDCGDENAVINAAETLIKMGLVKRRFQKGKYVWSLQEAALRASVFS